MTAPACNDNDKVRTNAARTLGNLLRLIKSSHISVEKWHKVCLDAIQKLCDQAKLNGTNSNMKVKWNACYAIGNFMKNTVMFDLQVKQISWQVSKRCRQNHSLGRDRPLTGRERENEVIRQLYATQPNEFIVVDKICSKFDFDFISGTCIPNIIERHHEMCEF